MKELQYLSFAIGNLVVDVDEDLKKLAKLTDIPLEIIQKTFKSTLDYCFEDKKINPLMSR